MAGADFRPTQLLARLARAEVDFVVIGGVAVVLQASPRLTRDLDITYSTQELNLARLSEALLSLEVKLRGVEEDLPFVPDVATLRRSQQLTLSSAEGNLDLLLDPAGSPGYVALRRRADVVELDGALVRVAAIEDLLSMKRAAGRPQDEIDVQALELARARLRGKRKMR